MTSVWIQLFIALVVVANGILILLPLLTRDENAGDFYKMLASGIAMVFFLPTIMVAFLGEMALNNYGRKKHKKS